MDKLERFYTPAAAAVALALAAKERHIPGDLIVEPSAGGGAVALAIRAILPLATIAGVDLDPDAAMDGCDTKVFGNYLEWSPISRPGIIVGNPPFSLAEQFARKAINDVHDRGSVILLLRLGFLASVKRADFWSSHHPAEILILRRRPSFSSDGKTDSQEYAIFVWNKANLSLRSTSLGWV